MDLEADAVAQAVAERLAEPARGDAVAGDRVGLAAGHARPNLALRLALRLQDDPVDLLQAGRHAADADRAGHVRAVVVLQRADVDDDRLVLLERPRRRHGVRDGRLWPAHRNRVERDALRAVRAQVRLQLPGQPLLGAADLEESSQVREGVVEHVDRRAQVRELRGVLDDPQLVHDVAGGHQLDGRVERRAQVGEEAVGQVEGLEGEPPQRRACATSAAHGSHRRRAAAVLDDLVVGRFLLGLLARPHVGEELRARAR